MKILLTGRTGQLGRALIPHLEEIADLTATGRSQLDLADETAIRDAVRAVQPDIIVNAAAYTAVDLAEKQPAEARALNMDAPRSLAEEASRCGATLVHFSTDYVFDGTGERAYTEQDATAPLNVYGMTKLDGEEAIRRVGVPHLILRLSWVYDATGANFLTAITRLLLERTTLDVVHDQIGCPTWSGSAARATARLIALAARDSDGSHTWFERNGGTYHMASPDSTSWYGLASAIRGSLIDRGRTTAQLNRIPTSRFPRPARRPANSVLCSDHIRDRLGIALPPWRQQLERCLDRASQEQDRDPVIIGA